MSKKQIYPGAQVQEPLFGSSMPAPPFSLMLLVAALEGQPSDTILVQLQRRHGCPVSREVRYIGKISGARSIRNLASEMAIPVRTYLRIAARSRRQATVAVRPSASAALRDRNTIFPSLCGEIRSPAAAFRSAQRVSSRCQSKDGVAHPLCPIRRKFAVALRRPGPIPLTICHGRTASSTSRRRGGVVSR